MTLSTRERMIVIAMVAVLALLVLDRTLLSPLLDRLDAADTVIAHQQQDLTAAQQTFDNRTRAQRKWRDMAGRTLQADAPNAESQVLNRVREWASATGLALTSLKPERNEKEQSFVRITIRATATGTMAQVAKFLHQATASDIPLRIVDVQINARKEGANDLQLSVGLATIYAPALETSHDKPV